MHTRLTFIFWLIAAAVFAADESDVLNGKAAGAPAGEMLERYLKAQADAAFAKRAEQYANLKTVEDWKARQVELKKFFIEALGGLPEKTPLNSQVTGTVKRDGYRVEKVVFESQPRHYVTALVYLPDSPPPYPAVLVPCGHSNNGKAHDPYQQLPILLARNGLAAMCFDPIGQGERNQFFKPDGDAYPSTIEHTIIGMNCIPLGTNTSRYMVWDAIRGVDYLVSRPDIDPKRLGCAGTSGGGTQTSYLMALDDRIVAAMPCCYITSLPRLWATIGPQDAEQNIFGQIPFGFGHSDFLIMHAPQPVQIGAATRDFFDINGSKDTLREARGVFEKFGVPERVDLFEADLEHNLASPTRIAVTKWMRRWLLDKHDAVEEPDVPVAKQSEIYCTPAGRVMSLDGARSVLDLNRDWEKKLAGERSKLSAKGRAQMLQQVRKLAGIRPLAEIPEGEVIVTERTKMLGCSAMKIIMKPEPGIELPGVLFYSTLPPTGAVLYINGKGKAADIVPNSEIINYVADDKVVIALDLRGFGETRTHKSARLWDDLISREWREFFMAYNLGRSLVGMRAEDVLYAARYLSTYGGGKTRAVRLHAEGMAGVPALHAVALEPELFDRSFITGALRSWSEFVHVAIAQPQISNLVPGALRVYDLPDLVDKEKRKGMILRNFVDLTPEK